MTYIHGEEYLELCAPGRSYVQLQGLGWGWGQTHLPCDLLHISVFILGFQGVYIILYFGYINHIRIK